MADETEWDVDATWEACGENRPHSILPAVPSMMIDQQTPWAFVSNFRSEWNPSLRQYQIRHGRPYSFGLFTRDSSGNKVWH